MFKVVIINNDQKNGHLISCIIKEKLPSVSIAGTVGNVSLGLSVIRKTNPDLVLLDIEMPFDCNPDLLKSIEDKKFDILFITTYNQYIIKAFKLNAINYILKPLDKNELVMSINRIIEKRKVNSMDIIDRIFQEIKVSKARRILIQTKTGTEYIDVDCISRIEAEGNYTKIFLVGKKMIYSSKKIKDIEQMLPQCKFFRTHKSHIVNLEKVVRYNNFDQTVKLTDSSEVGLSRTRKEAFLSLMEKTLVFQSSNLQ